MASDGILNTSRPEYKCLRYVDCDMFMRDHWEMAVGHKAVRKFCRMRSRNPSEGHLQQPQDRPMDLFAPLPPRDTGTDDAEDDELDGGGVRYNLDSEEYHDSDGLGDEEFVAHCMMWGV